MPKARRSRCWGLFLALFLSQAAQIIFVRRAFRGKIAFGTPLFRVALYYVCVLLVVAATLPNWYVPPAVRHENQSVKSPRKIPALSNCRRRDRRTRQEYPRELFILTAKVRTNRREGD